MRLSTGYTVTARGDVRSRYPLLLKGLQGYPANLNKGMQK